MIDHGAERLNRMETRVDMIRDDVAEIQVSAAANAARLDGISEQLDHLIGQGDKMLAHLSGVDDRLGEVEELVASAKHLAGGAVKRVGPIVAAVLGGVFGGGVISDLLQKLLG